MTISPSRLAAVAAAVFSASPALADDFTVILAGGSAGDGLTPTLIALKTRLAALDPKSTVLVFTGNYSSGELPGEDEEGREQAAADVLAHVTATEDFVKRGGQVYFLPGHQDFAQSGTKAIRRMRKLLNSAYSATDQKEVDVMPYAACGTPTMLELTDTLGLMLVNSQWWMQDKLADPEFNEGCEVKTVNAFEGNLQDAFRDYRNRRLIVAMHHPLRSYGELGGAFTAGAHLRPAPIVGTAWVLARQWGLVPQYQNHPLVHSYVKMVLNEADRNGSYVFASGHEANLQYLEVDEQAQVISGTTGRAATPTVQPEGRDFAAAAPGWAELVIAGSGEGEARFFSAAGESLFQSRLPPLGTLAPALTQPPAPLPPSPVLAGYSKHEVWKLPGVIQLFVGSYYSDAFALKLPYDVLDLNTELGGLKPFKIGGGLQTNSIRLHDGQGGDWAMRATTKDSSRLLPHPLNHLTPVGRLLDHGFTATHPEAALAMAPLAQAVGVLHLRPRLMYLPDQEALGQYRGFVTDEVVLLEQRPNELKTGAPPEHLGGEGADEKTRFKGYEDMVEKLIDKPAGHRLDQEAMLRARLLDIFVADWDRHRGQWKFAVNAGDDGVKVYTPIPLDRDQALSNYDGIGLMMARLIVPQARSLQPFTGNYGRIGWLLYNARDVDALLLNRVPHQRWMAIAAEAQAALTDQVIEGALKTWHPEAYALDGERIVAALKLRRDKLLSAAEEFYALINEEVDVVGSSHDDLFELTYDDTGAVRVSVRETGKDTPPYFERLFQPDETDEVNLYALEGDDLLLVHGAPHAKIEIRFIGGQGQDAVAAGGGASDKAIDASAVRLFDSPKGARIDPSISVRDERSNRAALNQYEQRENHEPDFGSFMPGLNVNPDDGAYVGGKLTYVVQGYKKSPFAARHELSAYLRTSTLGGAIDYRLLLPQSLQLLDQQADLSLRTPSYTRNFFGYTNRYVEDSFAPDFFRVRQARYQGAYGLSYPFADQRSRVGAQLLGQGIVTEPTPGRFVTLSPDVTADALTPRYFAGARLFAETNTFDSLTLPRRGIALHGSVESRYDIQHGNTFSTTYKAAAATAIPFDRNQRFVLLSRASVEGIVGDHPFYFAPTLGDNQLRAYHQEQLAGDVAFAHTTDLRIDVFRVYSLVPGTIGINLSVDHGRVFGAGISGNDYHLSYGGGIWWSIVDLIGVSVSYHRGLYGGQRFSLSVGPLFAQTGF